MDLYPCRRAFLRHHDDLLDHRTHALLEIRDRGVFGLVEDQVQSRSDRLHRRFDLTAFQGRGRAVLSLLVDDLRGEPSDLLLELRKFGDQGLAMAEFGNRGHDPLDLALYLRKTRAKACKHIVSAVGVLGLRLLELSMQKLDVRQGQPLRTKRLGNGRFQLPAIDQLAVGAGAMRAIGAAAVIRRIADGVRGAALAAHDQARQDVALAVRAVEGMPVLGPRHLRPDRLLLSLDLVPKLVVDDAQLRRVHHLPLLSRVGSGDAFAGRRVTGIRTTIPLEPAHVSGVVEKPRAAIDLAADGGVAPKTAAGTRNAVGVQLRRDRSRRHARGVQGENLADEIGLRLDDLPRTRLGRIHPVAESQPAGAHARQDPAAKTALGLDLQIFQKSLRDGAEDAGEQRRNLTLVAGMQLLAAEAQNIVESSDIGQAAAEAIESFDDHDVEAFELGIALEPFKLRAMRTRA